MILYALYVDAIFFPCHPYIWSTTVLHDIGLLLIISESYLYRTPTYYIGVLPTILDSYLLYRSHTYYIGVLLIMQQSDIISIEASQFAVAF